jgi:hypothetical protein
MKNVIEVPESALINDAYLWAVDTNMKLVKIDILRLMSDKNLAYVSLINPSLKAPYKIVSRPLTNFRTGMLVKVIPK